MAADAGDGGGDEDDGDVADKGSQQRRGWLCGRDALDILLNCGSNLSTNADKWHS